MGIKKLIKAKLKKTGYEIRNIRGKRKNQIESSDFFNLYFSLINHDNFFFVQIGANDGSFVDPLFKYVNQHKLRGLLVEPQKDVFEQLIKNYQNNPNLIFANVALSNSPDTVTMYTISDKLKESDFFTRGTAIASLNETDFVKSLERELRKNNIAVEDNIKNYYQKINVKSESFNSLLNSYNINKVDYVQIDCEGYDYEIIKMIDLKALSPKIINFESKRFSESERDECAALLKKNGYRTFDHGYDTCAYK